MSILSRRHFLIGGTAAVAAVGGAYPLVQADILPGRYRLAPYLGKCGSMPKLPKVTPGPVRELPFSANGRTTSAMVGFPPGGAKHLPVVVMLHGSNGDARTPFDLYGVQYHLAAAVQSGVPPFAMAAIDDWADVTGDPSPVITESLVPFLHDQGLSTGRIGLLGWSIGGRGVLSLASVLGPDRVAVVAATSPAISHDDAVAFSRSVARIPVSVTCGRDDALSIPAKTLLDRLRLAKTAEVTGGIYAGCHDAVFRRRVLPAQIAFLGRHLV
ncbi:hypothetical protein Airi01_016200 [Actinoallomurus iriomotensis]|uniref:Acyl-CoA:diacylglycerol acyltransferase n=2 Tax=Actinoallomurus iriomotensis TaxID=478107 RepID=A0A9W6RCM3_9ACTN|nr:hypothetical protein Airi01_016200 [Actinoallomurus iriomotensis]